MAKPLNLVASFNEEDESLLLVWESAKDPEDPSSHYYEIYFTDMT